MSEAQYKAFLEAVQADKGLQDRINSAAGPDAVVAIAREAGFTISADDLKHEQGALELTDEDLEGVTGGARNVQAVPDIEM